jgi:hypothetical protein
VTSDESGAQAADAIQSRPSDSVGRLLTARSDQRRTSGATRAVASRSLGYHTALAVALALVARWRSMRDETAFITTSHTGAYSQ